HRAAARRPATPLVELPVTGLYPEPPAVRLPNPLHPSALVHLIHPVGVSATQAPAGVHQHPTGTLLAPRTLAPLASELDGHIDAGRARVVVLVQPIATPATLLPAEEDIAAAGALGMPGCPATRHQPDDERHRSSLQVAQ